MSIYLNTFIRRMNQCVGGAYFDTTDTEVEVVWLDERCPVDKDTIYSWIREERSEP